MSLPASDISSASHLVSPYKWLLEKDKRRKTLELIHTFAELLLQSLFIFKNMSHVS